MEKLIVDEEGKITIPAHILLWRGLRPGNELTLVEAAKGYASINAMWGSVAKISFGLNILRRWEHLATT